MPQMSPLNWTLLYLFFMALFLLTITANYYIFLYKSQNKYSYKMKNLINWKW
uniref:ATP synthase complex subunit 8 n=1 Tax=Pityophthorus pubescens TaxID=471227 RepID=A0A343A6H4_9CUCU|nr:ATP synthase F0 subunit 8 [Pityophthorus pubescens]AOY40153.1 ATP synthase F0 subunit 8 [Pityophthorus pubescens]